MSLIRRTTKLFFLRAMLSLAGTLLVLKAEAVVVSNADELANAIADANSGGDKTIILEDGTYTLDDMLWVEADGITVRSASGNREAVIIQGEGMYGGVSHIFNVVGSNFTARDMTLKGVGNHAIQLQLDVDSVLLQNLHILDTGEQMVKVAYDPDNPELSSDDGIMENCLLEYSAGVGPQYYIGGIDAHNAKNWIVRNNTFKDIRSPSDDIAEHAIHFWSDSEGTLIELNLIINCDRGIGFGLGDRGHTGGIIRNNMIYHDTSEGFADVGIGLESAPNAQVYNNTIYMEQSYPNAIEYRFSATTGVLIANNLTNKTIAQRDGASATVSHNVTTAEATWFVNPSAGDLHLSYAVPAVVDQGLAISGLTSDFDGDSRPQGSGFDIGADEYITAQATYLIFESGDYDGDGTSDIAVFRPSIGLWAVRDLTRLYFGSSSYLPVSGDYDGNGTSDIGVFRGSSGLWVIRKITRFYFGTSADTPVPGDYDGDGSCDVGIFKTSSGLWAIKDITRVYFGMTNDLPVPGDYNGDGSKDFALFRSSSGLWTLRNISRIYFGSSNDQPNPGDFDGDGTWTVGIFRQNSGLWAIRGVTRSYFGSGSDEPIPADYDGDSTDDPGIFRDSSGLWAVRGMTRVYYGTSGDIPVTR